MSHYSPSAGGAGSISSHEMEVYEDSDKCNWKGIGITALIIIVICSLISAAIFLLTPHFGSKLKNERLKLEDILSNSYTRDSANATWVSNKRSDEILYRDIDGTVYCYNIDSQWKTIVASNQSLARDGKQIHYKYLLSADKRYLLLGSDVRPQGTYSFTAKYQYYDTANSRTQNLPPVDEKDSSVEILKHASWGPKGNQLLIIGPKNDIIYYPRVTDQPQFLTQTGRSNIVYNGIPDLMNEEFILKSNVAHWWHDSGEKLAYAVYDNSGVDQMPVVVYGSPTDNTSNQMFSEAYYPKVVSYPYPKPGRRNPTVHIRVADLKGPIVRTKNVVPPKEVLAFDHYVTAVSWVDDATLSITWLKRTHNATIASLCTEEASDYKCEKLFVEQLDKPGWLNMGNEPPIFSNDGSYYFMKWPVADGDAGTFPHIAMIYVDGNKRHILTHGQYSVTRLLAYRQDMYTLFYIATVPELVNNGRSNLGASQRHIFSVVDLEVPEIESRRLVRCLSCDMGPGCLYNDAKFSPSGKYMIFECKGPGIPRTELRRVEDNTLIELLNTNTHLEEWLDARPLPRVIPDIVPFDEKDITRGYLYIELLLPYGLSESDAAKKYPLVIELDGRPGSQLVNFENRLDWGYFLASSRDYVVLRIDGRGSGGRGDKWEQQIFHHLGDYEHQDVTTVIKYLREKDRLRYIDWDKIAIWGKGVGGYHVARLMAANKRTDEQTEAQKSTDQTSSVDFNCGVAIAPIVSWRNFVSAYSEKYIGMPFPPGYYINYDSKDIFSGDFNISKMLVKQFMIVHGTADRKVNIQHSMQLMKSLTAKGAPFKLQIYPDGEHELFDERYHVHIAMEEFFASCFRQDLDDKGEPMWKKVFPKRITTRE